jgi:PAS domain S-box-containing protein
LLPAPGYEPAELICQSVSKIFISDDPANQRIYELTEKALKDVQPGDPFLAFVRHEDGRRMALEILKSPILNNGRIVGIQGFAADLTEREEARNAIAASEREFRNWPCP